MLHGHAMKKDFRVWTIKQKIHTPAAYTYKEQWEI